MKFTNTEQVALPLAVWLASSDYDLVNPDLYTISATTLLKPIKQIVLEKRLQGQKQADVLDMLAAVYGSALHSSIEHAWTNKNLPKTLEALGYPDKTIQQFKVNPTEPKKEDINVYLEKRTNKTISIYNSLFSGSKEKIDWTISGKFDLVLNGTLFDNKSTSSYTFMFGTRVEDYIQQCSIYRWLNPELITNEKFFINYIFTDWNKQNAITKKNEGYPQKRVLSIEYPLMSYEETQQFIIDKLTKVTYYLQSLEETLPRCTDEELWRGETKYKYYSDPHKTSGRATRVFTDRAEAYQYQSQKEKGIVLEVKDSPKRCKYCACYDICEQRREYYEDEFEFSKS